MSENQVTQIQPLRVALLGCGVVGSQVVRLLREQADDLTARVGAPIELVGVAVRRPDLQREAGVPAALLTTDAEGLVAREDVDVVIEVIGGIEPARTLILSRSPTAHRSSPRTRRCSPRMAAPSSRPPRRPAETSTTRRPSRARSRSCGPFESPSQATRSPGFSASSTAPRTSSSTGWTARAPGSPRLSRRPRPLGYAEADPTADIEGFDAAAKAAILASLAFHTRVTAADVYREGIAEVTATDVASARQMDSVVKLLAICELVDGPHGPSVRPGSTRR